MTICILQGRDDFWSSSFIRAHIDHLRDDSVVLQNYYPRLAHNGREIRYFYGRKPWLKKLKKLLKSLKKGLK